MTKEDTITSYFMKISKFKNQLQETGEKISDSKLITVAINSLPKKWDGFANSIYARKEVPSFEEYGLNVQ